MKILKLINQNIPIWSVICGDHALKSIIDNINPKLLNKPNFLDPLENRLRLEVFKEKRGWIYDKIKDTGSFALVNFQTEELDNFDTCFTGISFKILRDKYATERSFKIKRSDYFKSDFIRSKESVLEVAKGRVNALYEDYFHFTDEPIKQKEILDISIRNESSCYLATNRTLLMNSKDNKIVIMDGTHRLLAYSISLKKKINLPNSLYAFYWNET